MSSSLRIAPLADTLTQARKLASQLGIVRVTDVTRLDRIGIPVFASIRPTAASGSLCVNAGKGIHYEEARVGAYMEAIEFALAEYPSAAFEPIYATPRDVLDGRQRPEAILDFCPALGVSIDLDERLACVEAEEVLHSTRCVVPAELVYIPFPQELGYSIFGSSSNGLCSGNSVLEASVHGLAEVIERDIQSFFLLHDRSALVNPGTLPPPVAELAETISKTDLVLHLRYVENDFSLPYFSAYIMEPSPADPIYISGGFGCHPLKEIAAVRAICEAAQGRLSFIHGGRDDLVERYNLFADMGPQNEVVYTRKLADKVSRREPMVNFAHIPDHSASLSDLTSAWEVLVNALKKINIRRICRVNLTPPDSPLHIVRIIVPGLESFNRTTQRVGSRLRDYVKALS